MNEKEIIEIVETEFNRYKYQKSITFEQLQTNLAKVVMAKIKEGEEDYVTIPKNVYKLLMEQDKKSKFIKV